MKKFVWMIWLIALFSTNIVAAETTYKIGVLAKRGAVKALKKWKATGDYLSSKTGKNFEIVPLDFDDIHPSIEKERVDFFLVNSSMYVTAKVKYDASAIVTMINSRQGLPLKTFGGVILTSVDNDNINSMADLKGKTFMAVKKSSFGGWQMAYKEILDAAIDPYKDFKRMEFGGKHDNVVLAIQSGLFECGTVRTDTLERMAAEGVIDIEEFKIINKNSHQGFPFFCSTALYPEWPLAKLKKTPNKIANIVSSALKQVKPSEKAAKDAKIVGWTDSLDYTLVENLQKSLKIGAYSEN